MPTYMHTLLIPHSLTVDMLNTVTEYDFEQPYEWHLTRANEN